LTDPRLSTNKTVVLHGELAILVPITYRKDFNLSKWVNEELNEDVIKAWILKEQAKKIKGE